MMGTLSPASNRTVLVVEDDADIRETLDRLLSSEGYQVRTCANGLEALERLQRGEHPDVIVLDLMMPVMDGWTFRVQQKSDPRIASIPVLAISADPTPKAAAIDADAYLRKPVEYDTLLAAIERTLLDMDRRRLLATQAETERLASLGTLAAGIAHEINNPLAYVMANLSYLADEMDRGVLGDPGPDLRERREALDEARGGCERIRAIVRDIQIFSRAAPDDARAPVDLRHVLDSSANIVAAELRARARLVKAYDDLPRVEGNEARLGQVLVNLLVNAAQAIPEGKAAENEVRLTAWGEGDAVIIEVSDTGQGISPEIRARIFDPFFTTKPVGVGTGLGLSIVHRLVTAMGGQIHVDSEVGRGSTFRLRLRAAPVPSRPPRPRTTPAPAPARARRSVLVVDDEEMIGVTLGRVLGHDHDVRWTTRPDEAIRRIRDGERFDVILCDLMMPEKNGADVQAAIAAIDADQAARMMFLTGGAFNATGQEFLARQTNPVIEKPFVVEELLARIEQVLAKQS